MKELETITEPMAPEGKVYVCCACGKTSRGLYGSQSDHGWDESCMLNAVLANEIDCVRSAGGRVTAINGKTELP